MLTKNISLLQNIPNIVSMSQHDVDGYKLSEEDIQQFCDSVKLFSTRAKSHIGYKYVDFHIQSGFKYLDIVKIPKYPLLAVFNQNTRKCLINISATLKSKPTNIDSRDCYSMVLYGHVCSFFSNKPKFTDEYEPFCNYMCLMFLKIFAKKYGITGSFADLIPQFKFIVYLYTLIKFFGVSGDKALHIASSNCKFDPKKLNIPRLKDYDLISIKDMIRLLSDTGTCPGLGTYKFVETMIRLFNPMGLAMFEDIMRFSAALFTSTVNSNAFFPVQLQFYSSSDYTKINDIIESSLSRR